MRLPPEWNGPVDAHQQVRRKSKFYGVGRYDVEAEAKRAADT